MLWGVDSAVRVGEELFKCVVTHLGYPRYWGRYLTTVPNVSDGLTPEEISFLQRKGVKVMPIYNVFREAIGYWEGRVAAANTIFHLERLGFPKGSFAFGNVEHFFQIDEAWIRGWVDRFYPSGYKPGLYHDPVKGMFSEAYCEAVKNDEKVKAQLVLWSAEPEVGTLGAKKAPKYQPAAPSCSANVWAWQYGRDHETCPVDTNLIDKRVFEGLW
ncbi:glycoside hydrolase domain-containing protein [Ammoniphilus sp. CFH 90114]|uniref:glycoside hydrolase domain-containing protein n=1 Tax=Ammoniphilus sp. CFH 90114 TaxID=2493665 RepID=UPI00100E9D63|nr:glycoside hydrolase domain-containing protein [Ammoniphilus sp. CFH 90114]RXT02879.1 DUF1906 domain-containing protein [Ammoniphilus sp. CFH 90114]